jgi:ribosomal protein S18 acetylase RimI-like enzyme
MTAAQASAERLELWVFQRNAGAIAFYEAHGFTIVASTDGAGNDEHEPDHRMAWSLR